MRTFQISDRFTTADIGLELEADCLEELFAAAAEGMFVIIFGDRLSENATGSEEINLQADSLEQLLVDWLSELLFLFDAQGQIPTDTRLQINDGNTPVMLYATVNYRPYDRGRDVAEHEVKAVTYHMLKIRKDDNCYRCHVVFDL
jgi:SHS2 domain-containing protein